MLTSEKRQEIIGWISGSGLRAEAKERALDILRRPELAEEDVDTVLGIVRADLEADFAEIAGANEALEKDEDYQALLAKNEAELVEVEQVTRESAEFVEVEMAKLEQVEQQVEQAGDAAELTDVKDRLGMN